MAFLRKRFIEVRRIRENAQEYFALIGPLAAGYDPAYHASVDSALKQVKAAEEWAAGFHTQALNLADGYQVFAQLAALEDALAVLVALYDAEPYLKQARFNMSQTYALNIMEHRKKVNAHYARYFEISKDEDSAAILQIISASKYADWVAFIHLNHPPNKFLIVLIQAAISHIVADPQPDTLREKRALELIIEQQKDALLGSRRVYAPPHAPPLATPLATIQGTLLRYNLYPWCESKPLPALFMELNLAYDSTIAPADNIRALGKRLSAGVIVLQHWSATTMEFDLRGLLDSNYIAKHNLNLPPGAALSDRALLKYRTANLLAPATATAQQATTSQATASATADTPTAAQSRVSAFDPLPAGLYAHTSTDWYVIESLAPGLYRLLTLAMAPTDVIARNVRESATVRQQFANSKAGFNRTGGGADGGDEPADEHAPATNVNTDVTMQRKKKPPKPFGFKPGARPLIAQVTDPRVPGDRIQGLIAGVTTRPLEYNKLHEQEICQRALDPKNATMLTDYARKQFNELENVKAALVKELIKRLSALVNAAPDTARARAALAEALRAECASAVHSVAPTQITKEHKITLIHRLDKVASTLHRELERRLPRARASRDRELAPAEAKKALIDQITEATARAVDDLARGKVLDAYDESLRVYYFTNRSFLSV